MEKRALVTGGAQGLGREVALLLGSLGYAVDVLDRESAWESVSEGGVFYQCDLTEDSGLDLVRRLLFERRYSAVVHAAGRGNTGVFRDLPLEQEEAVVALNVRATLAMTKWFSASVQPDDRAVLVLVSSMAGLAPTPGMSVYSATKRFVSGLAESVDWELRLKGFAARVVSVAPPPLATRFRENNGRARRSRRMAGVLAPECVARDIVRLLHRPKHHWISGRQQRFLFKWVRPWLPQRLLQDYVFRSALKD
jgi:short-subunit dehydrogenase